MECCSVNQHYSSSAISSSTSSSPSPSTLWKIRSRKSRKETKSIRDSTQPIDIDSHHLSADSGSHDGMSAHSEHSSEGSIVRDGKMDGQRQAGFPLKKCPSNESMSTVTSSVTIKPASGFEQDEISDIISMNHGKAGLTQAKLMAANAAKPSLHRYSNRRREQTRTEDKDPQQRIGWHCVSVCLSVSVLVCLFVCFYCVCILSGIPRALGSVWQALHRSYRT